jgi:hypothetical protein
MPRTPKPEGSEPRVFFLDRVNDDFLSARTKEVLRNYSEVLNSELDFLRLWGLTKISLPRLSFAAASLRATPMQYVQSLVVAEALKVPPAPPTKVTPPKTKEARIRRSILFGAPSLALIGHYSVVNRTEFSDTLNDLLSFSRAYGLPPHLHAALTAHAAAQGGSLRDFVLTLISDTTARLPDPPTKVPSSGRSKSDR